MISLTLILPVAHVAAGNAISIALGHATEADTYAVPLSATGADPATHRGCRTWATPGFVLMIEIATSGTVPEGTSPELAALALGVRTQHPDVMAALVWDAREMTDSAGAYAHWTDVLAAHGLQAVQAPMPGE